MKTDEELRIIVRETLVKQLELLSKRSEQCADEKLLPEYASAIVGVINCLYY